MNYKFDIYEEYVDVVDFINEVNKRINLYNSNKTKINIHKYVIFEDYPFLVRCSNSRYGYVWYINKCNLIIFNEMIQDVIMNNKNIQDEYKDNICLALQLMKNDY